VGRHFFFQDSRKRRFLLTSSGSGDAPALKQQALRALGAGRAAEAAALFERAIAAAPADLSSRLNLIAARRAAGDFDAALAAAEQILALDPRSFLALMAKGSLLERLGSNREAAGAYSAALTQAPPDAKLDPATLKAVEHARLINRRYVEELNDFIRADIADPLSQATSDEARRIDAFVDLTLRKRRRYQQAPAEFFYPGMPAIEFYDRSEFPWLEELEAATPAIRDEAIRATVENQDSFAPYIDYPDTIPLDQWRELNKSRRWSAFHFSHYGKPIEENRKRCPRTTEAIARLPQPHIQNRCPAAMFSALQPHTTIPPHTGIANIRLVTHLPLIVPEKCSFRVGGDTRPWRVGQAWVFDDTIEHEARNDSDDLRVILICDVWSPRLSEAERDLITRVMSAMDAFGASEPSWAI
jgi:aspartate beta-hydroxylase